MGEPFMHPRFFEILDYAAQLGVKTGHGFYDWQQRAPQQLVERRDRQIVRQLAYLKEIDAL